ncbi:MAG TPA: DUF5698 domain-containing protein [Cyclobacteriaceae bacterium]|nr:DUF5698 domain-containing protein [Cyclobacteriaceae bacterium]
METFFTDTLGIPVNLFSYVLLPVMIFLARIGDVSINTIRIIYVLGGRKATATFLGFFESFIWLMAIRQIFEHLDNWICYIAYPGGFAMGILIGMIIEEKIAYGKVIVRTITRKDIQPLKAFLIEQNFRFTALRATGRDGDENVVFTVLERERLNELVDILKEKLPTAFYTIEKVNRASDDFSPALETPSRGVLSWLRSIRRE